MSKILEIKAGSWSREDLPGYHVRYTLPDDAVVSETRTYADGTTANGPIGLPPTSPAIPQGASELGVLVAIWNGKVDASGNLLGKDGEIITEPENTDPLPKTFKDKAALLQWQVDHPYYHNPLLLDSTPVGQPGFGPPAGFGSTADGSLVAMQTNPQPAPITPLPVVANTADITVNVAWPKSGQVIPKTDGFGSGTATYIMDVPAGIVNPHLDHLGFIHTEARPGSAVIARDLTVLVGDKVVYDNAGAGDSAPGCNWTLGNPDGWTALGAQFNVNGGERITVRVKNGPNATTQPGDILTDIATPLRY